MWTAQCSLTFRAFIFSEKDTLDIWVNGQKMSTTVSDFFLPDFKFVMLFYCVDCTLTQFVWMQMYEQFDIKLRFSEFRFSEFSDSSTFQFLIGVSFLTINSKLMFKHFSWFFQFFLFCLFNMLVQLIWTKFFGMFETDSGCLKSFYSHFVTIITKNFPIYG